MPGDRGLNGHDPLACSESCGAKPRLPRRGAVVPDGALGAARLAGNDSERVHCNTCAVVTEVGREMVLLRG